MWASINDSGRLTKTQETSAESTNVVCYNIKSALLSQLSPDQGKVIKSTEEMVSRLWSVALFIYSEESAQSVRLPLQCSHFLKGNLTFLQQPSRPETDLSTGYITDSRDGGKEKLRLSTQYVWNAISDRRLQWSQRFVYTVSHLRFLSASAALKENQAIHEHLLVAMVLLCRI